MQCRAGGFLQPKIAFPLNKRLDKNVKPYIMLEAIYVHTADAALKGN